MTKTSRLIRGGQAAIAALAMLVAAAIPRSARAEPAVVARGLLDFNGADFTILAPGTTRIIGHAHYALEAKGQVNFLHGENRYLDGEHDTETSRLELQQPGVAPTLATYEHRFFGPDGAPTLGVHVDLKLGVASCVSYKHGDADAISGNLDFPSDTYAGASLLIPIEYGLRDGKDPIRFHFFTCAPAPRLLSIETNSRSGARWLRHRGQLLAVDLRVRLGWWDVFLEPFIPKVRAWFDPVRGFSYMGGEIQRFYRGPRVELVREQAIETGKAR